ncbi:MAG: iron ABC transporter permease [Thermoleophilia bacterium]|nr:iron ABC transporter permease [Thermoleophilia bacterium]
MSARRPPLALLAAVTLVAAVMAAPLAWVVRDAFADDLAGWRRAWGDRLVRLLADTLLLTGLVTVAAVVLGVVTAVLVVRTDLPFRRAAYWALALPLAVPPFVSAIAYADLFSPAGPVDRLTGYDGFLGLEGSTVVLALGLFPYVFLIAGAALQVASPDREEAARSLGLRPIAVLWRVTLPGIRAALGAGALLVAFHVLAEFGTPQLMRYQTFTTAIFDQLVSLRLDLAAASALSCVLVAVAAVLIAMEWRLRGRGRDAAATRPAAPLRLGAWRWPALGLVALVWATAAGLPVGWLVWQSLRGPEPAGFGGLSLTTGPGLPELAGNSLLVGVASAAACAVLALPVAVLAARHRGRAALALSGLSQAGYALPGVVVALALIGLVAGPLSALAGSVLLLVVGLSIRYLPEAVQATRGAVARVPPEVEEAARSLGHRPLSAFLRTTLPLAAGGVLVGALLVLLSVIRELPATMLLRPPGFDTLAVRVWVDSSEGLYRAAAPAGLVLVGICAVCLVVVLRRRKGVSAL